MKIEIETKYNIGDEVIGYSNGFDKYTIKDILIEQKSMSYRASEPRYLCTRRSGEFCSKSFNESELFTVDDIYERLGKVVTHPTTTEQVRHDINMYLGLKNILWNPHAYSETHPSDLIRWLESKFPEIEQYVKTNMK